MSKEEDKFAKQLVSMFPDHQVIRNWRPKKLKNEQTGKNLEIDFYIGKYALGFEYQGGIHFKDIKKYHNDSDKSRRHDMMKYEIIEKLVSEVKHKARIRSSKGNYKKVLSIVEVFDIDLKGNFQTNIITRINNTLTYYIENNFYLNAINLVRALCFIETGVKFKTENIKNNLVLPLYIDAVNNLHSKLIKQEAANITPEQWRVIYDKKNAKRKKIFINSEKLKEGI